jgi:sensor c-di-GMP phosphodiesterase-like protein
MALFAALGALAALGPMLASDSLIRRIAVNQGKAQLESMAAAMLARSETVLDTASDALASLSRGGVEGCTDDNIGFVAEVAFTHQPLKEIGIYDREDRMLCSNFGPARVAIERAGAVPVRGGELEISMMETRIAGHAALGLRRDADSGNGGLAAIIETSAMVAELLYGELRESHNARIELADGTLVGYLGQPREAVLGRDANMVEVRRASARYPLVAAVAAPRAALVAPFMPFASYAKIGGGVLGVALLGLVAVTARRRPTLEAEIDAAMRADEFIPYYQPIVDSGEGRASGCEVLLRWQKPTGELVRPDVFIPFAEATGQIIPITARLMRRVAADLDAICREYPGFAVSINLVAEHFATGDIVGEVRRAFAHGAVKPENLVFEITERRPLDDLARARLVMAELQSLGCRIALDDAGTGHSGLAYIQNLGMDAIKIDRMFIDAIGRDAVKVPVVDALIDLGRELNMNVVAEGVETEEQFAYLLSRGIRVFQGFLFARPMPVESFCRFVRAFLPTPTGEPATRRPARAPSIRAVAAI